MECSHRTESKSTVTRFRSQADSPSSRGGAHSAFPKSVLEALRRLCTSKCQTGTEEGVEESERDAVRTAQARTGTPPLLCRLLLLFSGSSWKRLEKKTRPMTCLDAPQVFVFRSGPEETVKAEDDGSFADPMRVGLSRADAARGGSLGAGAGIRQESKKNSMVPEAGFTQTENFGRVRSRPDSFVPRCDHPESPETRDDFHKMSWVGSIVRSPRYRVSDAPRDVTLFDFFFRRNDPARFGDQPFITDTVTGEVLRYNEVGGRVRRTASALRRRGLGLRPSSVVCFHGYNHVDYVVANWAVVACGATSLLIPFNATDHMEELCRGEEAEFVFCSPEFSDLVKNCESVKEVFTFGPGPEGTVEARTLYEEDDGSNFPSQSGLRPSEDAVAIFYTSGTTGPPKNIEHTHASVIAAILNTDRQPGEGVGVATVSPYHFGLISGFTTSLVGLLVGFHIVTARASDFLGTLSAIQRYQPRVVTCMSREVINLARSDLTEQFRLDSVEMVIYGGTHTGHVVLDQLREKFPNIKEYIEIYGSTETMLLTAGYFSPAGPKKGSVGQLAPFAEAKVVKLGTWEALGPGARGELCYRTPSLMRGYRSPAELTKEVVHEDGFYRSGDYGFIDEDGYIYVIDRVKELMPVVSSDREQLVSPSEIEDCLYQHPDVERVGVTGVQISAETPDAQVPRAFVKLKHHRSKSVETAEELQDFVSRRLSEEHWLKGGVAFLDEIPLCPAGKVRRRELQPLAQVERLKVMTPFSSLPPSLLPSSIFPRPIPRAEMSWVGKIARSPRYRVSDAPRDVTLFDFFFRRNDPTVFGDQPFITDAATGEVLRFNEVKGKVRRAASALRRRGLGLRPSSVVCFTGYNHMDYILANWAAIACGVTTLIIPAYAADHMEELCRREEVEFVFCSPEFSDLAKNCEGVKEVFTFGPGPEGTVEARTLYEEDDGSNFPSQSELRPSEDVVAVFYTSGTTGPPKTIEHTHASLIAGCINVDRALPPPSIRTLPPLLSQPRVLTCNSREVINLARNDLTKQFRLDSLEMFVYGGTHIGQVVLDQLRKKLPNIKEYIDIYGSTETMALTAGYLAHAGSKKGSGGPLLPFMEAKVVKPETWEALGPREKGELCYRTPSLMRRYRSPAELNKEVVHEDGFYRSGDYGFIDEDGYIYVIDRVKELMPVVSSDREQLVSPSEIEDCLYQHPDVERVGVTGVQISAETPDVQVPRAFVKLKNQRSKSAETAEELQDFVSRRLSEEHWLKGGVAFLDEIPVCTAGKVRRRELQPLAQV
ncbi:unnamed protein product [Darwinula stevensoni]|uniref:Uncharacterized protein n=1 Tax=Darwinula stevensoni TaxID=69355 RepID=A0A7R9A4E3_9CRUS|nr:unnamed protein product [Darwinula stevensoni]CAG0893436.1 unnamed protein product [Darwinula stevensoni]